MKTRGLIVFALVLILAGVSTLVAQTNAAEKSYVMATERFDPFGLIGPPVGDLLSPGTVQCPGFEPTGNPLQPCPVGSRTHRRNLIIRSRVDSSDPRLSGWATVEVNSNFDAAATGPTWGTLSLALDAGGTWDATWQGIRSQEGSVWILPLHISGRGAGGSIDGQQLMAEDRIMEFAQFGGFYVGAIQARILNPRP